MNISEIKDLLAQFDASTLREFSYKNNGEELNLSKNQTSSVTAAPVAPTVEVVAPAPQAPVAPVAAPAAVETPATPVEEASAPAQAAEGEVVESPLVGVAYLSPSPEKPAFVSVGDTVKKGQTLLIVEAMKVMNEVPAPKDGVITEILVANEEVVDYGKGLERSMNLSLMDIFLNTQLCLAFLSWKLLRKQLVFLNCLNLKTKAN